MSHLLIADDDPTIPRLLDMVLSRMGHEVSIAAGVAEAHRQLTSGIPVDLLILDFHLADGDAVGLMQKLGEDPLFGQTRILMSSAELSDDPESRETMLARFPVRLRPMVQGWIRKPYAIDALIAIVEQILGVKKPRAGEG